MTPCIAHFADRWPAQGSRQVWTLRGRYAGCHVTPSGDYLLIVRGDGRSSFSGQIEQLVATFITAKNMHFYYSSSTALHLSLAT